MPNSLALDIQKVSSTKLMARSLRETLREFIAVIKNSWGFLAGLTLAQGLANQVFSFALDSLRESGREDLALIAFFAVAQLIFSLAWGAIWLVAVVRAEQQARNPQMIQVHSIWRDFNTLMIEEVRILAAVLWRLPLLVIPSLTEYVRLTFVPYIVVLDPEYRRGQRDALAASRALSRGHFWLLSFTLLVSIVLPWIFEELARGDGGMMIWENPVGVPLGWVLTLLINLVTSLFLLKLFRGIFPKVSSDLVG